MDVKNPEHTEKIFKSPVLRRIAVLLLFFLCLSACTPKDAERKTSDLSKSDASGALSLKKTESSDETVREEEEERAAWSDFTGPLELQRENVRSRILPESFLVGPLVDSLSFRPEERDIAFLSDEFWKSFRAGKTRPSLLASYPHPLFLEELEQYSETGKQIRAVVTGRPVITGNSGILLCLVCSDVGCLEGSLYLIREEGDWFVEDWEIPFRNWPGRALEREEDRIAPPVSW